MVEGWSYWKKGPHHSDWYWTFNCFQFETSYTVTQRTWPRGAYLHCSLALQSIHGPSLGHKRLQSAELDSSSVSRNVCINIGPLQCNQTRMIHVSSQHLLSQTWAKKLQGSAEALSIGHLFWHDLPSGNHVTKFKATIFKIQNIMR